MSLTSNGTLPAQRYLSFVDAGLDELRISIDAADASLGDALAKAPRAWSRTVRTLQALQAARAHGRRFFLIVNTVVGTANRGALPAIVRFLLRFAPDDVKLITEVDERDRLAAFPELSRVRAELQDLLAEHPPETFPLLRRKLTTVFAPEAIGLEHVQRRADGRWRCFIPLTERTVDAGSYYPCSVYLREGGAPLGPLSDPPEVQRTRSAAFVRDADCLTDPICRRYCLHCTKAYNVRANAERP